MTEQDIEVITREMKIGPTEYTSDVSKMIAEYLKEGFRIIHYNTFNRTYRYEGDEAGSLIERHYTVYVISFQKGVFQY